MSFDNLFVQQWKAFENSSDCLASLSTQSSNQQVFTNHHPVADQYLGLRGIEVAKSRSTTANILFGYCISNELFCRILLMMKFKELQ